MKVRQDASGLTYVNLRDGKIARTEEISPAVFADYDVRGQLLGVEIIGATEELEIQKPSKAYLYHAWSWDCEACGGQNFCRSIHRDHDDGPAEEIEGGWREKDEMELIEIAHPNVVTCQHCQATYTADVMGSVESGDDDEH